MKRKVTQFGRMVQQWCSPAAFAVLLAGVAGGILLFVPPVAGYADNGDFARVLAHHGLYRTGAATPGYLTPTYGIMQYFNDNAAAFFSSQSLFVRLAIGLNRLLFSQTVFDVRFLAAVYFLCFLGALYLAVQALTSGRALRQYVLAAVCTAVFADSSGLLYFNSFYGQAVLLITGMAAVAALLLLGRSRDRTAWQRAGLVLLFLLSAGLLVSVNAENSGLALSSIIMGLGLLPRLTRAGKIVLGGALTTLVAAGAVALALASPELARVDHYQSMSRGVLLQDKNPGKALKSGGINPQFALMRGTTYYQSGLPASPRESAMQRFFIQRFDDMWLLRYYVSHLAVFGRMLDLAAKDAQLTQVKSVGDYPAASGRGKNAQTHWFTGFSTVMGTFFPAKFAFYILLAAFFLLLYTIGAYQGLRQDQDWLVMKFAVVAGLSLTLIIGMVTAVVENGDTNLAQHLFMVAQSTDWLLLILLSDVANGTLFKAQPTGVAK